MVIAILAIVAGIGLIIDGGNAWAQQRITQAGNDAVAEAGAVVLAGNVRRPADAGRRLGRRGSDAVATTAGANAIEVPVAYYTDICGTLLRPDGTKAAGTGDAAIVGGGVLPTNNHTEPDCPSGVVGPVAGVQAQGHKAVRVVRLAGDRHRQPQRRHDSNCRYRPTPGNV